MDWINATLDVLSEGYGRRNTSGWTILATTIIVVAGAFCAKELAERKRRFVAEQSEMLKSKSLSATVFSETPMGVVKYAGTLEKSDDGYFLLIEQHRGENKTLIAQERKNTLDEISDYLRSNTKFVLSDFKYEP